jgi:hypothetical protein
VQKSSRRKQENLRDLHEKAVWGKSPFEKLSGVMGHLPSSGEDGVVKSSSPDDVSANC